MAVNTTDDNKYTETSNSSKDIVTATTTPSNTFHVEQNIVQNFWLLWMDVNIDQSNTDYQKILIQLQSVVNDVNIFTRADDCVDFLTDTSDMKASLILDGTLGQQIVPLIHDIPQVDAIYIFCADKSLHEQWTQTFVKIKGVYTEITSIYQCLRQAVKQYHQDSIAMSFVSDDEVIPNKNLNQLKPSFMYTQIFKKILLDMEYDEQSIKKLATILRQLYYNNPVQLNIIDNFERNYCPQSAIRWYTSLPISFEILNRALRKLEADKIIYMGFFLRDIHRHIQELHQQQISSSQEESFVVYRGQGLAKVDFETLLATKGGLMSFNNFLSTSENRNISLMFAESASDNIDTVGILFKISINPSISSVPYASIKELSSFEEEEEILFSMHTVFRVKKIKPIVYKNSLYQVNLQLTADDDEQLRILTKHIEEEAVGATGWRRLGNLLLKVGQPNQAEELYEVLLTQTSDEGDKAIYYNQLGYIKHDQGDYKKAIEYNEEALEIYQKKLPENFPNWLTSYNNIGVAYRSMGEYLKALSFYDKVLAIQQKFFPQNQRSWAQLYNNIALVHGDMGEYSKALFFYDKALEIYQNTLPNNHPFLATSYNNIALVHGDMGEYSKSLSFHDKALEIFQNVLPETHPYLATSYNNIAVIHDKIGEYSKALSFYDKALEVYQKIFPENHPNLATFYNNIGEVHRNMGEYAKALSFYEKALEIYQKVLSENHPSLTTSYNNIASVYDKMGEYLKALSFYRKALEIYKQVLPETHPNMATVYNNIGGVYINIRDYSIALSFYDKALDIREKNLPENHSLLADSYNSIGGVYTNLQEYSKALSFFEKAIEIYQKSLRANHPLLATSYNNMATMYNNMGEYSKALSFYEKSLDIREKSLPENHPDLAQSYNNIASVYHNMGEQSQALWFYKKTFAIEEKNLSANQNDLIISYNKIVEIYYNRGEYSNALLYLERALDIFQRTLPANHPNLEATRENIEVVKKKL